MRAPLVLTLLAAAGCYSGPSVRSFAPAQGPRGVAVDLHIERSGGRVRGELLELQSALLLVLRDNNRVVIVPVRAVDLGNFTRAGQLIENGQASRLEQIRLLSRYPAGLTPEVRARLLATYGQSQPDTVGRVTP